MRIDIPGQTCGIAMSETLTRSKFEHLTMELTREVVVLVGQVSAPGAAGMAHLPAIACLRAHRPPVEV